ncbi:hypothetical protein Nepgr_014709 [Nepenthes gracilis]|uniref:Uncharacterized protein n=1 Tax=Nepenthes gracilis TaxID=150966 RepID=A0AAD3XQ38_NEPGR|nr:hypothetical protein Nepgr_014709 [Nepenthes gracilis]
MMQNAAECLIPWLSDVLTNDIGARGLGSAASQLSLCGAVVPALFDAVDSAPEFFGWGSVAAASVNCWCPELLACPVQFHNMDSDDGAELLNCRFVVPWGPGLFCFAAAMFSLAEGYWRCWAGVVLMRSASVAGSVVSVGCTPVGFP